MQKVSFIKIYQIYFKARQKLFVNRGCIGYSNTKPKYPRMFEFGVFMDAYERGLMNENNFTGFVSLKFTKKTGIKIADCKKFITENSGYNVYTFNPFPEYSLLFPNIWMQGELAHEGLIEITQSILNQLDYKIDLFTHSNDLTTSLFCNYFIADKDFWKGFMDFSKPIFDFLFCESQDKNSPLMKVADHSKGRTTLSTYIPFILERLFSTYVKESKAQWKIKAYTKESQLQNKFLDLKKQLQMEGLEKINFENIKEFQAVKRKQVKEANEVSFKINFYKFISFLIGRKHDQ